MYVLYPATRRRPAVSARKAYLSHLEYVLYVRRYVDFTFS